MRILIIDDEFVNRKLLIKMVESLGESDVAANGQEGIEAFKLAHEENNPYDLILLDIMMPVKDGLEALEELRQIEKDRNILYADGAKIIMTTAVDEAKTIMHSFREGCEAYIVKPISKEKLFQEIEQLGLASNQSS